MERSRVEKQTKMIMLIPLKNEIGLILKCLVWNILNVFKNKSYIVTFNWSKKRGTDGHTDRQTNPQLDE